MTRGPLERSVVPTSVGPGVDARARLLAEASTTNRAATPKQHLRGTVSGEARLPLKRDPRDMLLLETYAEGRRPAARRGLIAPLINTRSARRWLEPVRLVLRVLQSAEWCVCRVLQTASRSLRRASSRPARRRYDIER